MATCKSLNGESENGMRGIGVGMKGTWKIGLGMWKSRSKLHQ